MELIRYLTQYFFTREQLLERAGITGAELERLQHGRMMPRPSYRLQLDIECDSFFGAHREQSSQEFYAKGSAAWIAVLGPLADEAAAYQVFAQRYRQRLAQLAASGIVPGTTRLICDEHIVAEWDHFLSGSYGLCTVSGQPEDIAAKEAAIVLIKETTAAERALTDAERRRLGHAVDLLDSVSASFAPHEVASSSRRRYVDDIRRAWGL